MQINAVEEYKYVSELDVRKVKDMKFLNINRCLLLVLTFCFVSCQATKAGTKSIAGVDFENGSGGYSDATDDLDATDGISVSRWTGGGFSNDNGANGDVAYEGTYVGRFQSAGSYFDLTIPGTVICTLDNLSFAYRGATSGASSREIIVSASIDGGTAISLYDVDNSGNTLPGRTATPDWAGARTPSISFSADFEDLTGTTVRFNFSTAGGGIDVDGIVISGTISVPEIPPSITNTTPSYVTDVTAGLAGTLDSQQTNVTVYAYWSTNDYDGQVAWEGGSSVSNMVVGSYTNVTNITVVADVENLAPETDYYYTLVASNAVTNIWAMPRATFTTDPPPPPPGVTTVGGATNIGVGTASLRAELTNGVSANVYICWGPEAGNAISTSTWENVVSMGLVSEGSIVTNDLTGLLYGVEYSYRVYAENSEGSDWSDIAQFTTEAPDPVTGSLKVDFGEPPDEPIQSGWEGMSGAERNSTATETKLFSNSLATDGTVDVTIANMTHWRDYAAISGGDYVSLSDLLRDSVLRVDAGTMTLTLSDLSSGTYDMVTYHHGTEYEGGGITVTLTDADVTDYEVFNESVTSGDTAPSTISTGSFSVVSDGSDVLVRMTHQGNSGQMKLNGFELDKVVSEPFSIANTVAANESAASAELRGTLYAVESVCTVYAAYSESNNTSAVEWDADDTKTLILDDTYTNVSGQAISVTAGSLAPETTYYYTLLASNAVTNIWAMPGVEFRTVANAVAPGVTTNDGVLNLSYTTASLRGEQTAGGNADVYICWGETAGNTTSTSSWANVDFMGTLTDGDIVTNSLTDLPYSTLHHYVVYATNAADEAWSSIATFTTDTPGANRYATGSFTWSSSDNAWSFESGGPYDQPWEPGKNAILEGDGTSVSTVTLGEDISLGQLVIDTDNYRITGNSLNFSVGGTITNLGNSVHVMSGITGEPDVYAYNVYSWNLNNPATGLAFGPDGFKLLPSVAPIQLGALYRQNNNFFWLGGSVTGNTIGSNTVGHIDERTYVDGGEWTVGSLYGGWNFEIRNATLIANGPLTAKWNIRLYGGGVLHVNDPDALGSDGKQFRFQGGNLDNSSGGSVTSAHDVVMEWIEDFSFIGSQGANSDLHLGAGAVTMHASRTVTVVNAAATLTVGGVIADGGNTYSLTKAGGGTLELTGDSTYSGETIVEAGTLRITQPYLHTLAGVRIADGAKLDLGFTGTNNVPALFTNGVAVSGGTWGAIGSGADNETALLEGTGILSLPADAVALDGIRYWDGGTSDISGEGNSISAGGAGTWSSTIKNWDAGFGVALESWNNAGDDRAILKGASGVVTLGEDIYLDGLSIETDGYEIQSHTLHFSSGSSITNAPTGNTTVNIYSGVTGSPDVWVQQASGDHFAFSPSSSVTLGSVYRPVANYFTMGGSSTGNTIAEIILTDSNQYQAKVNKFGSSTWTVNGEFYCGWLSVNDGTLISNGRLWENNNFNIDMNGGKLIANGTVEADIDFSSGTLAGTAVVDTSVSVPAGGALSPGNPTGTMTITNNNCTIDGTLEITIDESLSPVSASLDVDGVLDISSATLSLDVTGVATDLAYTVAEYNSLIGGFAVVSGLPDTYWLDYNYKDQNKIVIRKPSASVFRFR